MAQMMEIKKTAGCFVWHELYAKDQNKAAQFYCDLMNWATQDWPMGEHGVYKLVTRAGDEQHFAGIMDATGPQFEQVPSHWMIYIQVDDVDASASKATSLGANVIHGPEDIPEVGRFAVITDPQGATFTIFKSFTEDDKPLPFAFVWNELVTPDLEGAMKFYTELFGWTTEELDLGSDTGPSGPYKIIKNHDVGHGGCMQMTEQMQGVPPHWMPYIGVGDIEASLERAQELGATVDVPVIEIAPEIGKFCMITDPAGAKVSLYQSAQDCS